MTKKQDNKKQERVISEEEVLSSDDEIYRVEKILDIRKDPDCFRFLIKWENYSENEQSWEPLVNLQSCEELLNEFFAENKNAKRFIKSFLFEDGLIKEIPRSIKTVTQKKSKEKRNEGNAKEKSKPREEVKRVIKKPIEFNDQSDDSLDIVDLESINNKRKEIKKNTTKEKTSKEDTRQIESKEPSKNSSSNTTKLVKLNQSRKSGVPLYKSARQESPKSKLIELIDVRKGNSGNKNTCSELELTQKAIKETDLKKADPKISIQLEVSSDNSQEDMINSIKEASNIDGYIVSDNQVFFRLDWSDTSEYSGFREKLYSYEALQEGNPYMLSEYLKRFINFTSVN